MQFIVEEKKQEYPALTDAFGVKPPQGYVTTLKPTLSQAVGAVQDQVRTKAIKPIRLPTADKSYIELFNEAERDGFKADARKYWQKVWETRRTKDPAAYAIHAGPSFTAAERELEQYLDADDPDVPYYLITINPRPAVRFADLSKRVSKCLGKKWIRDNSAYWYYVYEQRSVDAASPSGYHCHLMLERPIIEGNKRYRYSAFIREIRSTFTSIVGGDKAVDIKPIKPGTERRVIKYFSGDKADPAKLPAVEATRLWRRQIGIADFYESTPFADVDTNSGRGAEYAVPGEGEDEEGEEGSGDDDDASSPAENGSREEEDEEGSGSESDGSVISVD